MLLLDPLLQNDWRVITLQHVERIVDLECDEWGMIGFGCLGWLLVLHKAKAALFGSVFVQDVTFCSRVIENYRPL